METYETRRDTSEVAKRRKVSENSVDPTRTTSEGVKVHLTVYSIRDTGTMCQPYLNIET